MSRVCWLNRAVAVCFGQITRQVEQQVGMSERSRSGGGLRCLRVFFSFFFFLFTLFCPEGGGGAFEGFLQVQAPTHGAKS